MSGWEFLVTVIISLVWPPKGVIYFEEQVLQWIYAIGTVWIAHNAASILVALAIYFLLIYVVLERPHFRMFHLGHTLRHFINFVLRTLFVILFAWVMLIYGALRGEVHGTRGHDAATMTYTFRRPVGRLFAITQSITRLSLHFRLGRGIFRFFYRLLGRVRAVASNNELRMILARLLAMVVILWGVWHIPFDLTH